MNITSNHYPRRSYDHVRNSGCYWWSKLSPKTSKSCLGILRSGPFLNNLDFPILRKSRKKVWNLHLVSAACERISEWKRDDVSDGDQVRQLQEQLCHNKWHDGHDDTDKDCNGPIKIRMQNSWSDTSHISTSTTTSAISLRCLCYFANKNLASTSPRGVALEKAKIFGCLRPTQSSINQISGCPTSKYFTESGIRINTLLTSC